MPSEGHVCFIPDVMYGCEDCDWPPGPGSSKNGVGLAAQHAQRTGHAVWADAVYAHRWNMDDDE